LYACGSNNKGQLGIDDLEDKTTLTLIPSFKVKVTMVAGGWDFTFALSGTQNGDFFINFM